MSIFLQIKKRNCQEITSSQLDNGLLEVVVPENCSNSDIDQYVDGIISSEFAVIENKQKKATEMFQKKAEQLIEKYKKHFNLNLQISLCIQTNPQKLNDCRVEFHETSFDANMSLTKYLQFVSDDILEKVVRLTVFDIACEYETLCRNYSKDYKYKLIMPDDELETMKSDCYDVEEQLNDFIKRDPIFSIR